MEECHFSKEKVPQKCHFSKRKIEVKCHFSKNLMLGRGSRGCYNADIRTIAMLFALVVPVVAQEQACPAHWGAGGQMPQRKDARKDARQRMLEKYDANKDGKLDEAERKAMKKDRG